VVVSTTHDAPRLRRCIDSIARGAGDVPYEIVVVLNGADDDVIEAVRASPSVRVAASRWNLGFAGGCNLGRAEARGELIVILHDDAEAQEGWLPALVDAAASHPGAGVIGSRVLGADGGRLHLAGAVIFSDATTELLGRGAEAEAPEHMVARPVDYCSSCAVLVRAQAWDEIGGLDELLFPGGYVDADLGTAAWTAGWRVRYEPSAAVRHRSGGSMTSGFKAFIHGRNRDRFRAKWAEQLALREPPAPDRNAAAGRALARAATRDAELAGRATATRPSAAVAPVDPDQGPRLATLELRLLREYVGIVDTELDRVRREHATAHRELDRVHSEYASLHQRHAEAAAELEVLRERARTLDAILAGGWWRLRGRLLPLIRPARRLRRPRRRAGP
jgi:GT2 family glycosyltransferase